MKKTIFIFSIFAFTASSCGQTAQKQAETPTENKSVTQESTLVQEFSEDVVNQFYTQLEKFYSIQASKPQDINLYWLWDLEQNIKKKIAFITLSDNDSLSEHPDSLTLPDLSKWKKEDMEYFKLSSPYRERFLDRTKISETDTVFVYDYAADKLLSFPVNDLNVVAYLNVYMDIDDCPYNQFDYYIGFEIDKNVLTEFDSK
jgi:hypothetical protein